MRTGYLYDNGRLIAQYDASSKVTAQYVHGSGLGGDVGSLLFSQTLIEQGETLSLETSYYLHNHRGDVVAVINETGTDVNVNTYRYSAFGEIIDQTTQRENDILFSSKRYDASTDLSYFGARYYDASIGRFISRDPLGYIDGPNGYIYCSNNPINLIDPFGANKRDSLIATYEYEFAYKQENEIFNPQDPPDNNHSRNDGQTIPVAPNLTPSMVLMMMTPEGGAVSVALPGLAGLPTNLVPFQHYYSSQNGGDDNDPNNNAAESSDNKVHGNSKQSKKQQHGYLIYDQENGDIAKVGISGAKLNKNGSSRRANIQINFLNRLNGFGKYAAAILENAIQGREAALDWEQGMVNLLDSLGKKLRLQKRPTPKP